LEIGEIGSVFMFITFNSLKFSLSFFSSFFGSTKLRVQKIHSLILAFLARFKFKTTSGGENLRKI
jgi:hypothetical protein